jgi:hypothetical protein
MCSSALNVIPHFANVQARLCCVEKNFEVVSEDDVDITDDERRTRVHN